MDRESSVRDALREFRTRIGKGLSNARRRVAVDIGALLQKAAAATVAWLIARYVIQHHEPFFAPIAAVISLNAPEGERGANALRLLLGVLIGITAGELAILTLERNIGTMALAVLVAMTAARAIGGTRVTLGQSAVSAILCVAVVNDQLWLNRTVDALLGAGVSLVFTQFLFSPEPVAFVHRAQSAALAEMAAVIELTARALERTESEAVDRATRRLSKLGDQLAELERVRRNSYAVVRHSLLWRSQTRPLVNANESTELINLLGLSCVTLARLALTTRSPRRKELVPGLHELSSALHVLAGNPGSRAARQVAAEVALRIIRPFSGNVPPMGATFVGTVSALRMVAADVLVFSGVGRLEAVEAVREGAPVSSAT